MDRQLPSFIVCEQNVRRLKEGVIGWNEWREANPAIEPDLSEADLRGIDLGCADDSDLETENSYEEFPNVVDLRDANLYGAKLNGANLRRANLIGAKLAEADMSGANLIRADLSHADLENAILSKAEMHSAKLQGAQLVGARLRNVDLQMGDLSNANLSLADCTGANFSGASLSYADLTSTCFIDANLSYARLNFARLVETKLTGATLTNATVYGIAAWSLDLEGAKQSNLIITPPHEPEVSVEGLEVAQFVYLLLNNAKIRHVIDTITSKVVLILGRFTLERKVVLEAIREELRQRDYVPVVFDFEKPASKDLTGTISTLANMARFIIADLTDPSSVPHELATLVPTTVIPVQTLLLKGQREYAMFPDLARRYHWVLEPYQYNSSEQLLDQLNEWVISPAEAKAKELTRN